MFHNAEMGPAIPPNEKESQLNILTASPGEHILHCNRYLRLKVPEVTGLIIDSSIERMDTFKTFKAPKNKQDVINMLGDTSAKEHCVFRLVESFEATLTPLPSVLGRINFECAEINSPLL